MTRIIDSMSSIKMPDTKPPGKLDVVQLRTQHIRTLEVLQSVMQGHADLTGQLHAAQRAAKSELDAAERPCCFVLDFVSQKQVRFRCLPRVASQ